jgi:hypothetical protein
MRIEEARKIVLETLEVYTGLQMKAIQELKDQSLKVASETSRRARRRQSLVDMSYIILTERRTSLHVSALVDALRERFGRITDRDALSSALAKKARQGILFQQTAPATFAALAEKEETP